MRAAIRRIFRSNLAIKEGERILLVTDDGKHAIAEQFLEAAEVTHFDIIFVEVTGFLIYPLP